jgi:hypothetical protein
MLRVFGFENIGAEQPGDRNWRILDENSKTIQRQLVWTDPTYGSPAIDSYFTLYGPIVFFAMRWFFIQGSQWSTGCYIEMPFDPIYAGTTKGNYFVDMFPIYSTSSGEIQNAQLNLGNRLYLGPAYVSPVISPSRETLTIKGWYYRN